jgi:hypothetical protein
MNMNTYDTKLRLPTSTNVPATRAVWLLQGYRLAKKIAPTSSGREASITLKMIGELRQKLAINISDSPSFCRKEVPVKEKAEVFNTQSYLVIGGQDAADLADAMVSQGIVAKSVVVEEWKVKVDSINMLVEKTKEAVQEARPTTIILCGLEMSVYQAQTEEGYNMPISKTGGGDYHVEGELAVCNREAQLKLFKLMEPLWKMATDIKLVVVCPFLLYITGSCCDCESHITNRQHQNYESKLKGGLDGFKMNLKMYLHTGGHHHCRVMDPLIDTKEMKNEEKWMANHTKPTAEAFGKVAAGLHAVELRLKQKRQASVSTSSNVEAPAKKMAKTGNRSQERIVTVSSGHLADGQLQYQDIRVVAAQEEVRGRGRGRGSNQARGWCENYGRGSYRSRGGRQWHGGQGSGHYAGHRGHYRGRQFRGGHY